MVEIVKWAVQVPVFIFIPMMIWGIFANRAVWPRVVGIITATAALAAYVGLWLLDEKAWWLPAIWLFNLTLAVGNLLLILKTRRTDRRRAEIESQYGYLYGRR